MHNKRRENSLRSLTSLYTVVIGVALSSSILKLIDPNEGLSSLTITSILLFLAFICTLFPFYHGALRHLDDAYIENDSKHIKDGALILDFLLLFFHGMAFVVLSLMLTKPGDFAVVLLAVLTIDVIWGIFTHYGSSSKTSAAEWKWTIINLVTVLLSVIAIKVTETSVFNLPVAMDEKVAWVAFGFCFIRTLVDYIWGWKFYFPSLESE